MKLEVSCIRVCIYNMMIHIKWINSHDFTYSYRKVSNHNSAVSSANTRPSTSKGSVMTTPSQTRTIYKSLIEGMKEGLMTKTLALTNLCMQH